MPKSLRKEKECECSPTERAGGRALYGRACTNNTSSCNLKRLFLVGAPGRCLLRGRGHDCRELLAVPNLWCFTVWRNLNRNPERQDDDMNITKEQVQHTASLSKLKLDDAQQQRMIEDLADMIAFADQLNELNTDTIKATAQTLSLFNVFREDEIACSFERDIILSNAPEKDSGYYLVPKVVE